MVLQKAPKAIPKVPSEGVPEGLEDTSGGSEGDPEDDLRRGPEDPEGIPEASEGFPEGPEGGSEGTLRGGPEGSSKEGPWTGLVTISKGARKADQAHYPGGPGPGESTMRRGLCVG